MKQVAILAAIVVAVAACGGAVSTPQPPPAPTGAAPTATSVSNQATPVIPVASPTVALSVLADKYTAIANKGNAALDQCSKDRTAAGNDLAKAKVAAGECLAAINGYASDLGASRWGSVQPQVDDVVKALGKVQVLWGQMANATTLSDLLGTEAEYAASLGDVTRAISVLRSALGQTQNPTPTETVANIEAVPLLLGGRADTDIRELTIQNGTVVAVDINPDGTVKDFAITVAGKKIGRTCADLRNNVCSYTGVTFWLNVTSTTRLASPDHMQVIGQGPAAVSRYIVVGERIPWMIIPISTSQFLPDWNADVPGNVASLAKLNSSTGKSLPRANMSFVFSSIAIALNQIYF